jgi:hypothetical protein
MPFQATRRVKKQQISFLTVLSYSFPVMEVLMNLFFKLGAFAASVSLVVACGGGGGATGSKQPQLSATISDLSNLRSTFADTTLIDGGVLTTFYSFEKFLNAIRFPAFFTNAYAQTINSCNDNIKAVAIEKTQQGNIFERIKITGNDGDNPCFTSSQEVGEFIAVQAKNLYQGEKKCDIALLPKSGGALYCLSAGIPSTILNNAGDPEFKFSQAFAGISSLKSLGGKITDNGKYFFVAFSDDGAKINGYDGVYRIDLSGSTPVGQLAYLSEGVNPRSLSFDGYQQLENGDMIVTRMDLNSPAGSQRRYTYYVGVGNEFPGVNSQQVVLINSAVEFGFDGINSPIFVWAKNNMSSGGEPITNGSSQNIVFSGSQDPLEKVFYYVIGVNRYLNFQGEYFNKSLIKVTVTGDQVSFEDYGPTSLSFFGTAGINSDLDQIYWIKDWTAGQMSLVTRNVSKSIDATNQNHMPELEVNIGVNFPSDYRPTLLYTTENKVFVSTVGPDFYDSDGLMNLRMFVADKVSNGVYWTAGSNVFNEIDLSGYTGDGFRVQSIIPSLVTDKLTFRLKKLSDDSVISLDVSSEDVDSLNLGSRGAVSSKHAVIKGR